jgi:hypothetical protein
MILTEVFNNEIGLKSDTFDGESTFGISVMWDPLILSKHTIPQWKASHKL